MIKQIIADTGVIVGYLSRKDQRHKWTLSQMKNLPTPFLTCEAVITEACHLMRNSPNGKQDVLRLVADGVLIIDFSLSNEVKKIQSLIDKYDDVPMDFADACLVRMSEQVENAVVFTVDVDFLIYGRNGREKIPLIFPE